MVELIIPKCPRCGADIDIHQGSDTAVCKYCDAEVLVVDKSKPSQPVGDTHGEIEKKKLAIELAAQELRELQVKASTIQYHITMVENPAKWSSSKTLVLPFILLLMAIMMDLIIFPLFYFLQMWAFYGLTRDGCLGLGLGILFASIGSMIAIKIVSDKVAADKRNAALMSPEYQNNKAQLAQLQPQIAAAQAELEKREQELKALVQ